MKALAVKNTSHESLGGNHKPAKQAQLAVNRGVAAFPANIPYSRQPSICPCDGGCPRCSNEGVIQLKLTLGQPNDKYEQEADRVADQVVNKPGISTIPRQDSGSRPETVPTTPLTNQITPFVRREPIEEEDEKEKEPVQAKLLPFPIQKQAQAEVEEQPEEEEEEEEQVQADIQRMAGGREEIQPKGLKENGRTAGGNFKARLAAGQGAGQILPTGVLSYLAARLGADFSGVRVHTDSTAVEMSAELKARAFTYGSDIYFNQGNYDPASSRGLWLLTHELTHVMQQGKADPQPTAKVRKSIEKEAEEEKELDVQAKAQTASISSAPPGIQRSFLDSVTGAAGAVWDATAGQLIDAAGEVIEMSSEFFWGLLETVAPAFAPIVREIADKGILGFLKDKISPALNHLFDGLNDNSTLLGPLLGTYMEMAAQAGEIVIALASGDCRPLFAAVNRLKETLSKMAGDAWNAVTDFFAPVGAFFSDVWQSFGAPVLDWLGQTATDVWNEISGLGQQIWAWTQPFRDKVGGAWDWVKGKLGIGGQEAEGDSEGGLVQWIQAKAEEAWSIIKEELQPVIEPIQAVVEKVEAILPLDAIFNLRETIQGWLSKAEAMGQAMGDDGSNVAEQQTSLRDEILPAILAFIESLRVRLIDTGLWISEKIGAIVDTVSGFIDALMSLPLVSGLQAAVMWIQTALLQLADWYRTSVVVVFNLVGDGLVLLSSFIRPILDILNQIVETLKNLMGKLPDLILGPVWWLLPACIKNPIKDFILNQILLRIPFFQDFLALGDLWQKFKATAMTILKQIFVDGDILGALWTYFKAILGIFGLPPQLITNIIVKAAQALGDIIANPIGFIINILKAVKEGFVRFFANILKHLMGGVTDWLFGQIAEAGITLPQDFSLKSILGLVFQILGLTMEKIWQKLAAKIGPDKVEKLKTGINLATGAWEWVKLAATEEPAAIWDKLKEKLSDLWTTVITGVVTWVNSVIIVQGTKWLLSFLDVSGIMPTITATIALYKAVESFFEYLKEMLEIVNTVFNGIADIAKGAIGTAAGFLESALANSVPIIIAFLANQFGLGRLGSKLREIIGAVQEKVDGAIDWLIEKAVNIGKAFLEMLKSGVETVKAGAQELAEWWKTKYTFKTRGGEEHKLFFEGEQEKARLKVSSEEMTYDQFIVQAGQALNKEGDKDELSALVARAIELNKQIIADIATDIAPNQELTVKPLEEVTRKLIEKLDEGKDKLTGSDNDPFWIMWHKEFPQHLSPIWIHLKPPDMTKPLEKQLTPVLAQNRTLVEVPADKDRLHILQKQLSNKQFQLSEAQRTLRDLQTKEDEVLLTKEAQIREDLQEATDRFATWDLRYNTFFARWKQLKGSTKKEEVEERLEANRKKNEAIPERRLAKRDIDSIKPKVDRIDALSREVGRLPYEITRINEEILELQRQGHSIDTWKETIGITFEYYVHVGRIVGPAKQEKRGETPKQFNIKDFLGRAGFTWSGYAADHVIDLSLGGEDTFDNLWPVRVNPPPTQKIDRGTGRQQDEWNPADFHKEPDPSPKLSWEITRETHQEVYSKILGVKKPK